MILKIKLLSDGAHAPTKAHLTDACFDIYADLSSMGAEEIHIGPHGTAMIPTGFATEIPHGYWGAIFARSGIASKCFLRPAQGVPVIDEPYRGEWKVPMHNDSEDVQVIRHGERIAQFMLLPWFETEIEMANELTETDRGSSGFGASGKM